VHNVTAQEQTILQELQTASRQYDDWAGLRLFDKTNLVGIHVAVMSEPFLSYVLGGQKTIESRFSIPRIAPYGCVAVGDVVLLKNGPVVAAFTVTSVEQLGLDEQELQRLAKQFSKQICADDTFWQERRDKKYATLLGVGNVRRLTPIKVSKRDERGWVTVRVNPKS